MMFFLVLLQFCLFCCISYFMEKIVVTKKVKVEHNSEKVENLNTKNTNIVSSEKIKSKNIKIFGQTLQKLKLRLCRKKRCCKDDCKSPKRPKQPKKTLPKKNLKPKDKSNNDNGKKNETKNNLKNIAKNKQNIIEKDNFINKIKQNYLLIILLFAGLICAIITSIIVFKNNSYYDYFNRPKILEHSLSTIWIICITSIVIFSNAIFSIFIKNKQKKFRPILKLKQSLKVKKKYATIFIKKYYKKFYVKKDILSKYKNYKKHTLKKINFKKLKLSKWVLVEKFIMLFNLTITCLFFKLKFLWLCVFILATNCYLSILKLIKNKNIILKIASSIMFLCCLTTFLCFYLFFLLN